MRTLPRLLAALLLSAGSLHAQIPGTLWEERTLVTGPIRSMQIGGDGRTLLVAYEKGYRVWDLSGGRLVAAGADYAEPPFRPQMLSPDGSLIAGQRDQPGTHVVLLDARSGEQRGAVETRGGSLRFTDGGGLLLHSESSGHLSGYSVPGLVRQWRRPLTESGPIVAVSSDETTALVLGDPLAALHNLRDGSLLRPLLGLTRPREAAFALGGTRVVGFTGDRLVLWDAATGQPRQIFEDASERLVMRPGGRLAVTMTMSRRTGDMTVRVWDLQAEARIRDYAAADLGYPLRAAMMMPAEDQLVVVESDGRISFVDLMSGAIVRRIASTGEIERIQAVAASPDGRLVATGSVSVTLRNASDGSIVRTLHNPDARPQGLAFSPDGDRIAGACGGANTNVWSVATGEKLYAIRQSFPSDVAWSPDGSTLAVSFFGRSARLYDAADGRLIRELTGHRGDVRAVAFSPDSRLVATASDDLSVIVWNAGTGAVVRTFFGHQLPVLDVIFTRDGRGVVAAGADGRILHFPLEGAPRQLAMAPGPVRSLDLSADGSLLHVGGDRVMTYDLARGEIVRHYGPDPLHHAYGYHFVATIPASGALLDGTADGDAIAWRAPVTAGVAGRNERRVTTIAPNPATDRAVVALGLDRPAMVVARLAGTLGTAVLTLDARRMEVGESLVLDVASLPPGIYHLELFVDGERRIGRVAVVR